MGYILLALGVVLLAAIALGLWGLRRFSARFARRAETEVPPAGGSGAPARPVGLRIFVHQRQHAHQLQSMHPTGDAKSALLV